MEMTSQKQAEHLKRYIWDTSIPAEDLKEGVDYEVLTAEKLEELVRSSGIIRQSKKDSD